MGIADQVRDEGNIAIAIVKPGCRHREVIRIHNRIGAVGRNVMRDLFCNVGNTPQYLCLGTGVTEPKDEDKKLETVVYTNALTRVTLFPSILRLQTVIGLDQVPGLAIGELGLFVGPPARYTTAAAGMAALPLTYTLFARAATPPVTKALYAPPGEPGELWIITWDVIFAKTKE